MRRVLVGCVDQRASLRENANGESFFTIQSNVGTRIVVSDIFHKRARSGAVDVRHQVGFVNEIEIAKIMRMQYFE